MFIVENKVTYTTSTLGRLDKHTLMFTAPGLVTPSTVTFVGQYHDLHPETYSHF